MAAKKKIDPFPLKDFLPDGYPLSQNLGQPGSISSSLLLWLFV